MTQLQSVQFNGTRRTDKKKVGNRMFSEEPALGKHAGRYAQHILEAVKTSSARCVFLNLL